MVEVARGSACEKHREFVPLIAAIERVEGAVEQGPPWLLRADALGVHEGLAHGLIPHAVGEGRTVFPTLRRVTGKDDASREMLQEHREIARLTDELERIGRELASAGAPASKERALRDVLRDLRAAVRDHFEAEEQACFQVLQAELGPDETRELYEAMERATAEIRRAYE
jgi:iron-sulfur cluster repair protein YtfE (RIC family)